MEKSDYLTLAINKFVKRMRLERRSPKTIKSYARVVEQLAEIDSRVYRLTNDQIQDFILTSRSESSQNLKINALQKFFRVNHPQKRINVFVRPRKVKKLIEVLTKDEMWSIIDSITHPKQKAIISGLYLGGLRLNELLNLKYHHIDRQKGLIIIREGKGRKDRYVPLHQKWIEHLTRYARFAHHGKEFEGYIFRPYSESSVRAVLKRKAKKLKIKKNVYPHLLRDCYATHLLQQGVDTRFIQEILGHSRITTTQKYEHVASDDISKIALKVA